MTATMKQLKALISATGHDIEVEETRPHEMSNEGSIQIDIDQELKLQFRVSCGTSCVAVYYRDIAGSRGDAIASLMDDIRAGFEPMGEETANACGVDL